MEEFEKQQFEIASYQYDLDGIIRDLQSENNSIKKSIVDVPEGII